MQHLDEGMIHAWLDGQLPRDEAAAVEAHVAECRPCADAVAEARGLIAASSRILTALDAVPRDVAPKPITATDAALPEGVLSLRREAPPNVDSVPARAPVIIPVPRAPRRWFTAPTLAAAAAVVVAVGMFSLYQRDTLLDGSSAPRVAATSAVALDTPSAVAERVAASEPSALGAALGRANEGRQDAAPPAAPPVANARAEADGARPVEQSKAEASAKRKQAPESLVTLQSADRKEGDEQKQLADEARRVARAAVPAPAPVAKIDSVSPASTRALAAVGQAELAKARDSRADTTARGGVRGRVTDANNTGINGAMVQVAGTNTAVTTNSQGEYSLGGVQAGAQQLQVRRIGYQPVMHPVSIVQGQTVSADIVIAPSVVALNDVVVTGTSAGRERSNRPVSPAPTAPPANAPASGAAFAQRQGAAQVSAAGCYEWTVTSNTAQQRTRFLQVPRRLALDTVVTPSSNDGIWYLARDLARTGTLPNGLWRPIESGIEVQWVAGVKTSTVRLTGSVNAVMRGNIEEIDRSAGIGESGNVISMRRPCE